jgi:hypothetical protein
MTTASADIPANAVRLSLHQKQAEVYADPRRFKVLVAGRRFGKTHYSRTRLIAAALKVPGRYWYIAPTRIMAKDMMWSALKMALHSSWLTASPLETELRVLLKGGGEIQLHGAEDPNSLKGRALRGVVFDEFADIKLETWTEAIRPALSDYQGWADFIATPQAYNHLHALYLRGQSPESDDAEYGSWQFRTLDNPFIKPSEIEAARADMDERTYRQEYEASFEALSGRIYYAFQRGQDVRPVTLIPGIPVSLSFDFNVQPATCVIGQARGEECYVWREVFVTHAGGEATRASASKAKALLVEAGWHGAVRIYGDATGRGAKTTGPSDHAVLRELFPGATWCIPNENPHVKDRYSAVNSRFQSTDGTRRGTVDPSCTHLCSDLEQVIFDDKGEADKKGNPMLTHISDALGYWIAAHWPVVRRSTGGGGSFPQLMV